MQRRFDAGDGAGSLLLQAGRCADLVHQFAEHLLGVVALAEKAAIEGLYPGLTLHVADRGQYAQHRIGPATLGEQRAHGLVLVQ